MISLSLYNDPKPPIPVSTLPVNVDCTLSFILSTALFPASISTPADL